MMRLRTKIAALPLAALAICAALQLQRVEAASVVLMPTIDLSVTPTTPVGHWNGTGWDPPTYDPGVVNTTGTSLESGHGYICDPCNDNGPGNTNNIVVDSRAIVQFDLSTVPGPITSATLKLRLLTAGGGGGMLTKIGSPWLPTDTAAAIWSVVGDGSSSTLANPMGNATGFQNFSGAGILAAVQGWQTNAATNRGFGLKQNAEGYTGTVYTWASNEFAQAASRPMLTVEYTAIPEPASAALLMLAAGCVTMLRRRQR